jgi:hypothetical protein
MAMSGQPMVDDGSRLRGEDARRLLLAGAPVTERRLDLAGVSTAVLEGGDGPPVVLLHGQGGWAGMWLPVAADLVATCRVVAPDLPGLGASEVPGGPPDAARVLAWLGELIDRTCASPPALVGASLAPPSPPASRSPIPTGCPGWCWSPPAASPASGRRRAWRSRWSASSPGPTSAPTWRSSGR